MAKFEIDPTGLSPYTPGAKLDLGKPPVFRGALQYFPRALETVAAVSEVGAQKYTWKGWESVPDGINRYGDALGRHITKEGIEGLYDSGLNGTGLLHAAQAAWNALARLELMLRAGTPLKNPKQQAKGKLTLGDFDDDQKGY